MLLGPPAREVEANELINAVSIDITDGNDRVRARNWMADGLEVVVNPWIKEIATSNGDTSWFLFASPSEGRPAGEFGRLRGHEEPRIFVKSSNAREIGGGDVDPITGGQIEDDSIRYRVRHCWGGTTLDPRAAVASNGTA